MIVVAVRIELRFIERLNRDVAVPDSGLDRWTGEYHCGGARLACTKQIHLGEPKGNSARAKRRRQGLYLNDLVHRLVGLPASRPRPFRQWTLRRDLQGEQKPRSTNKLEVTRPGSLRERSLTWISWHSGRTLSEISFSRSRPGTKIRSTESLPFRYCTEGSQ